MEAKDIVNLNILTHFILEGVNNARFGIYQGQLRIFNKVLVCKFFINEISITFFNVDCENIEKELDFKDLNTSSLGGIDNMILEIFDEAKRGSNA